MDILRAERGREGLRNVESVKLSGRPNARGYVAPRTERGQDGQQGRTGATLWRVFLVSCFTSD